MDRLEHYRQIVRTFLEEYAQASVSPNENVTAELVFDEKRDRFLLAHVGWQGARRIYGCPMQIDIIDNKVWLQHNATEVFVDQGHWFRRMWKQKPSIARVTTLVERTLYGSNLT